MSRAKLSPFPFRHYFDDYETLVFRVAGDAPSEDQSSGPVNLPILPDVIDLYALTAHKERERPSHSRVGDNAQDFLFAQSGAEHPFADHFRIEPCVEDALRRRVHMPANADFEKSPERVFDASLDPQMTRSEEHTSKLNSITLLLSY